MLLNSVSRNNLRVIVLQQHTHTSTKEISVSETFANLTEIFWFSLGYANIYT